MPLFDSEKQILSMVARMHALFRLLDESPHLQPKKIEAKVIEEDMRDCACQAGDYDANKQSTCDGCLAEEKRLFAEEVEPERLFDGDGQPAGWI